MSNYKYDRFKRSLITNQTDNPNAGWLPFPKQRELKAGTLSMYRTRINKGIMFGEGFKAQMRNGHLYAKYVGTDS
ncbi:hypothetical protein HMPREF2526_06210 [Corynebacterium sp. HMSC070E08]|uniref:hypothetical protein n=1 Tax=Corynebacterium sp. HMSC070E08 TaxID=1715006 RepID=UPI0008A24117|nr:hypothetical protein [Corynebacterium sp. HMSC070E08]OFN80078.1 hypothetical protein HMPREF2526_06210 [Corynebacterium sp. HMSC070E08]